MDIHLLPFASLSTWYNFFLLFFKRMASRIGKEQRKYKRSFAEFYERRDRVLTRECEVQDNFYKMKETFTITE